MALNLTPEQRAKGKDNFHQAVGKLADQSARDAPAAPGEMTRRGFMKGLIGAGAVLPVGAAAYFGYASSDGRPALLDKPVKAALIGGGDEGGVLVGEHNPRYLEFVAVCDFRPSNQKRIFVGETYKNPASPRRGFNYHYGTDANKKIKLFTDYKELLADKSLGIEAVVIALPLHLHAPVAIAAMEAGKHVLCEKLMAWNISQCKQMIQTAKKTNRVLAIGHQRHYSMLYAHAVEVLKSGILGDIQHIRAQWHRNNSAFKMVNGKRVYEGGWHFPIPPEDAKALASRIKDLGYKDMQELVQWRLFERTGGGLMAELGSHQLDASSIFLKAISKPDDDKPESLVLPLAVSAMGGKFFYDDYSECEDHVYCTYEFPGKDYKKEKGTKYWLKGGNADYNDVVIVTYSSINTNSFEPYGECIMGSEGTMLVELERDVSLFGKAASRSTDVMIKTGKGGAAVLESSGSEGPADAAANKQAGALGQAAVGLNIPSRGYREEMEHFAYIISNRDQGMAKDKDKLKPRCDGVHAMADAIIALTANVAMQKQERIVFRDEWFDPLKPDVPDPDRKA